MNTVWINVLLWLPLPYSVLFNLPLLHFPKSHIVFRLSQADCGCRIRQEYIILWSLPVPSFCINSSSRDLLVSGWKPRMSSEKQLAQHCWQSCNLSKLASASQQPSNSNFSLICHEMIIWQTKMCYKSMAGDNVACEDGILLERWACSLSNLFPHSLEELCKCSNLKVMSSWNIFQLDLSHHCCSSDHTQQRAQKNS